MNLAVKPNLGYRDARAAIRFLVAAFGFEEVAVYDRVSPDTIAYAELRWPGGGTVTLYSAEPSRISVADLVALSAEKGGYPAFSVHLDCDNPDGLFARAVAAGAAVVRPVEDSPFGTRGFVVRDLEGLYWSFGTPLPRLMRDAHGRWRPGSGSAPTGGS